MLQYFGQGKFKTFRSCAGIMVVHTTVQLTLCVVQNRKNRKYMMKEMLLILSFSKPIFDLRNLVRNNPKQPHQLMPGLNEMIASKQIEAVFEAVPQMAVQYFAFVVAFRAGELSKAAVTSIFVSALTAAYAQAVIGYDGDVDPDRREKMGLIYGYVPDRKVERALVLVFSALFGACQLLIRCFSLGLYYNTFGGASTMGVMTIELALMLAGVWIVQGTLFYWIPAEGAPAVIIAFGARLTHYVTTTTSPCLQFRHPYDLGGRLFTCTMFLAIASSWLMVWRVETFKEAEAEAEAASAVNTFSNLRDTDTDEATPNNIPAFEILALAMAVYFLSLVGFFLSANRTHRRTFWWTKNGKELNLECNWTDKPNSLRVDAVKKHRDYQPPVEEMVEWARNGWGEWKTTKPKWFVDNKEQLLTSLPDGAVSEEDLRDEEV